MSGVGTLSTFSQVSEDFLIDPGRVANPNEPAAPAAQVGLALNALLPKKKTRSTGKFGDVTVATPEGLIEPLSSTRAATPEPLINQTVMLCVLVGAWSLFRRTPS